MPERQHLMGHFVRRFLIEEMAADRNLSPNTQKSYRDTIRLLFGYIAEHHATDPVRVTVEQVDATVGGVREACQVLAQSGAGFGAGAKERVAPARGVGRALVGAGGKLGVHLLVLGPGAAQAPCARPVSCAVSSSPWGLRGTARPARRGERIAARGRRGGAAPAPSRLECHRGVQCGTSPLSVRAQGRHPRLSRAVSRLVQSAHPALGTAQGDQRPRVPDRTASPRLAHAARLSALTDADITRGRGCALTSLDSLTPSTVCLGTQPLVCVKMNYRILIGPPFTSSPPEGAGGVLSAPRTRRPFGKRMRRDSAHTNPLPLNLRVAGADDATVSTLSRSSVPSGRILNHSAPTIRRHDFCGAGS